MESPGDGVNVLSSRVGWELTWGGVPLGGWSRRGKGLAGLCVGGPGSRPGFTAHQLCDGAPKP